MRDLVLILAISAGIITALPYPFVGLLLWAWFTVMDPHEGAYGIAQRLPWNLAIAIVALMAWLLSRRERKLPGVSVTIVLVVIFLSWMTFNSFFAVKPDWSWPFWDRTWKIYLMAVLATILATNRVRFHALIWTVVISLSYWGVRGGVFTLLTGGGYHVYGPAGTELADNNNLALIIVMILPLLNYLRQHTASRIMRMGIVAALVLNVLTVLGSYSRGGFIALGVLVVAFWLRTKNKLVYPVVAVVAIIPLLKFMPESFWHRMDTIQTYQTDASFDGRVQAWQVAYHFAVDHFPFGAGFYAPQLPQIFNHYFPGLTPHAAHSIFFQVLGEHGFIGLAIFLAMIASAFLNLRAVMRLTAKVPEMKWANDLARMIQLSLLAFCVGGAALSLAYYDLFTLWICLSAGLLEHTRKQVKPSPGHAMATARPAVARPYPVAMRYRGGLDARD
ncbi:MAG TPA: putative O-glycosylation ligase, exosortase A system-associated [Stellaceae bacterium]|nr:putative O-glycosylation ligase, exosortase A system-associated [Stellaceae bacterium]